MLATHFIDSAVPRSKFCFGKAILRLSAVPKLSRAPLSQASFALDNAFATKEDNRGGESLSSSSSCKAKKTRQCASKKAMSNPLSEREALLSSCGQPQQGRGQLVQAICSSPPLRQDNSSELGIDSFVLGEITIRQMLGAGGGASPLGEASPHR
jgi:hypothetical protein